MDGETNKAFALFHSVLVQPGFLGALGDSYKELCDKEQKVSEVNPGHKSAFKSICDSIKEQCCRFNNEANALKVHFPKAKATAKGKAKAKAAPPGALKTENADED